MSTTDPTLDLDTITLLHGGHDSREDGMCAMEAVAYIAREPHSDHPACASRVLAAFMRQWNDDLDDEGRQRLKPLLPRLVGTADDGHDETRAWMCADWLVRTYTPAWLELAGVTESATALRALAPIADLATVQAARPSIDDGSEKARAAWDAAGAAAGDAAGDAAGAAAGDAAWDAAWAAARDAARAAARDAARAAAWAAAWAAARAAAGDAAWDAARAAARAAAGDAARAAARDAAWDAAWAAAWAAARAAAGDAARAAAGDAARAAARAALAPTKTSLQESALELLDAMLALGEAERAAVAA